MTFKAEFNEIKKDIITFRYITYINADNIKWLNTNTDP